MHDKRPKSKKQVKEAVASDPASVYLEGTDITGREYSGTVASAPDGEYYFVGPVPNVKHSFYGIISKRLGVARVK